MRSIHTAIATILFGATTIAVTYGAALTTPVGGIEKVENEAYGTPPNAPREPKTQGDDVAYQELLETLQRSGMLVKFDDGSQLTLGSNSKVLVDAFVYAPGNADSNALISLPTGALRYITGKMPKGQTTIDTPTATMVLRGTNVKVLSDTDNTLLVVDEGSVSVHNKLTGEDTVVEEGQSVEIGGDGTDSTGEDEVGDSIVDDGFGQASFGQSLGTPEQRRSDGPEHHESTQHKSKSSGPGFTPG